MSKRRCKTCPGRDGCIHVSIYDGKAKKGKPGVEEKEKVVAESESESLRPRREDNSVENSFKQIFMYPPTKEDREANNRINKSKLFEEGRMIPAGYMVEKCPCGFTFSELRMESNKPVIHHSKLVKDSRDGALATYMLATGHCGHLKYYSGSSMSNVCGE